MTTENEDLDDIMVSLKEQQFSRKDFEKIKDFLKHYRTKADYLTIAAQPLSSMATSTAALTIMSVLLFLNGINVTVKAGAGLSLILLFITIVFSLFVLFVVYRAKFRLARVQYHIEKAHLLEKAELTDEECAHLIILMNLAKNSEKTLEQVEWAYHHILWRLFYFLIIIIWIILSATVLLELIGVISP